MFKFYLIGNSNARTWQEFTQQPLEIKVIKGGHQYVNEKVAGKVMLDYMKGVMAAEYVVPPLRNIKGPTVDLQAERNKGRDDLLLEASNSGVDSTQMISGKIFVRTSCVDLRVSGSLHLLMHLYYL